MEESKLVMQLHIALINSTLHTFPEFGKIDICSKHGVYIIYNSNLEILHVGTTKTAKGGLNQRLLEHVRNQSSFAVSYLKNKGINLRNGYRFRYIEVENIRIRILLEALTAGLLCPAHIGTGEKKNSS